MTGVRCRLRSAMIRIGTKSSCSTYLVAKVLTASWLEASQQVSAVHAKAGRIGHKKHGAVLVHGCLIQQTTQVQQIGDRSFVPVVFHQISNFAATSSLTFLGQVRKSNLLPGCGPHWGFIQEW